MSTTYATVGDILKYACPSFSQQVYTTENKHLFGIYTVVNQVVLLPKVMIHMFVT